MSGATGSLYLRPGLAWACHRGAAFGEDAGQQLVGGFVVAAFGLGEMRLGGDEFAFAGGLEDAGAVACEVGLGALERGDGGVEAREVALDGGDDAALLGEGWEGDGRLFNMLSLDVVYVDTSGESRKCDFGTLVSGRTTLCNR